MIKPSAVVGAVLTLSAGAALADAGGGGVYVGASAGYTELNDFDESNIGEGPFTSSEVDDSSDGTEIFFGMRFGSIPILSHFAIEAGYMDLGNFSIDANTAPGDAGALTDLEAAGFLGDLIGGLVGGLIGGGGDPGTFAPDNYRAEVDVEGWQYGVVGFIPITERLQVFGRGGIFDWKVDASLVATDRADTGEFVRSEEKTKGEDPFFGGGISWTADKHWSVRAEWRRMQMEDDDLDFISAGGAFHF